MIYSIQIHDAKQAAIPWWEDVGALNIDPAIEFKPGLNILWGPNGSGKSTVLSLMGRLFHCQQGYTPVVTDTSIRTLWEGVSPSDPMPMGVELHHIFRKKDGLKLGAASKIQDQWVAWTESGLFISGEVTRKEVAKKALLLSFAEPLPG